MSVFDLSEKVNAIYDNKGLSDLDKGLLTVMQREVSIGSGVASGFAYWGGTSIGGPSVGVAASSFVGTTLGAVGDRYVDHWRGKLEEDKRW